MIDNNKNPFEISEEEKKKQIEDMWNKYENSNLDEEDFEFFTDDEY